MSECKCSSLSFADFFALSTKNSGQMTEAHRNFIKTKQVLCCSKFLNLARGSEKGHVRVNGLCVSDRCRLDVDALNPIGKTDADPILGGASPLHRFMHLQVCRTRTNITQIHTHLTINRTHTSHTHSLTSRSPSLPVGVFTLGDVRSFYGLTSKIPPLGSTLHFDTDVKETATRHRENPLYSSLSCTRSLSLSLSLSLSPLCLSRVTDSHAPAPLGPPSRTPAPPRSSPAALPGSSPTSPGRRRPAPRRPAAPRPRRRPPPPRPSPCTKQRDPCVFAVRLF